MRIRHLAIAAAIIAALLTAQAYAAPEPQGRIIGTDVEYSELAVTKDGVEVKLTNTGNRPVKISLKMTFFDRTGNTLGYSLFGLREIPAGAFTQYTSNHLSGRWKPCRDAARMLFEHMTYEVLY